MNFFNNRKTFVPISMLLNQEQLFVGNGQRKSVAISQVTNSSKSHELHIKLKDNNKRILIMNSLRKIIDSMNAHIEQATNEQNDYKV